MNWIDDFIGLIFPRICVACGNNLWRYENTLCRNCEYHLPKTNFHLDPENPVARLFWGRVVVGHATAFLHFNKGSRVQQMIHALKYKGRKDVGIWLGRKYGVILKKDAPGLVADHIVPVPLHRNKLKQRGYNQSEQFALGLSESLGIPVKTDLLIRHKANETQTRKSRFNRYRNVQEIFALTDPDSCKGKHIILADDVITTGATLESCVQTLHQIPDIRISILCIATASL